MIRSTFQHLTGVGPITEAVLWRAGISDWSELLRRPSPAGVPAVKRSLWERELAASERALADRATGWFASRLPPNEHWRLYPEFRSETAFLDIETTSLSPYEGIVTVVGVHGGGKTRSFVADDDLNELPAYLRKFRVLVTFNGILFDVPFLETAFPQLVVPPAHIDLRYVLRRLGYSGGLKRIEQAIGVGDRSGVEGIHGPDAVRLWQEYRRGRKQALELLVEYNRADTVNLEPLLEFAVRELQERLEPLGPALGLGAPAPPTP